LNPIILKTIFKLHKVTEKYTGFKTIDGHKSKHYLVLNVMFVTLIAFAIIYKAIIQFFGSV
jgi:hypothetical protein